MCLGRHGELGQDRHARAGRDYVREGREARGPELELVRPGARAEGERLVAEAVAVDEEEDAGVAELRRLSRASISSPADRLAAGSSDGQQKFVQDFVTAWTKVMNLDRFDLA
jgi:hypothetical protein